MKKYVLAGASFRAYGMFAKAIQKELSSYASIDGVYDINPIRAEILGKENGDIPVYYNFDEMLRTVKPDAVIVTTVDAFHHEYIIKALMAGCDAITEKPMTIDAEKVEAILDAERKSGKKVYVTFNYRFIPYVTKVKELISSGVIGRVYSVDFEWLLDRNMSYSAHGTSYFRRWNRYMQKSGGLLVHKATHHFDMVNWWIEEQPVEVAAFGKLRHYGRNGAFRGERCLTCSHKQECEFYMDITKQEFEMKYYVTAENKDGYYKDSCVFAEDINIYDTMSVNVQYDGGALLNYTLNAHTPYEGWRASLNGSNGRLELEDFHTGILSHELSNKISLFDLQGNKTTYEISKDKTGGHGGGDTRLRRMLFAGDIPDPLGHQATSVDGALSVLIGASANISIAEKRIVNISDLLGDKSLLKK